jgi:glutathione synthase/RimK-type ligase-like ATP-grasp enzyme
MRIALLAPAPDYPEPWRWAYDAEAAALASAGADVQPISWVDAGGLRGFDLVLPLVAWGYHLDYLRWLGFLERAERDGLPLVNPPELLRWNGDKAYLAELGDVGVATVPTMAVESCCGADLEEARRRFGSEWLVIKPPVSASAMGAHRLGPGDDVPAESRGKPMIVQPLTEGASRRRGCTLRRTASARIRRCGRSPRSAAGRSSACHGSPPGRRRRAGGGAPPSRSQRPAA